MSWRTLLALALGSFVVAGTWASVDAQRAGSFMGSSEDPAIAYTTASLNNAVVDVNRKLQDGAMKFTFDSRSGFLRSALEALQIPVDSQLLVFSRTSLQGKRIGEQNPRALFFNDRVALGWVRGGDLLEVAAHDQNAGVVFYTLEQQPDATAGPPQFKRAFVCLGCHVTGNTLGVPGLLMFSTTRAEPTQFSGLPRHIDQNDPLKTAFWRLVRDGQYGLDAAHGQSGGCARRASDPRARVGGGFVRRRWLSRALERRRRAPGADAPGRHDEPADTRRVGSTRRGSHAAPAVHRDPEQEASIAAVMNGIASEVVDYLLFVDEAKLTDRVRGASGFAERFSSGGPRDRKGRSLYELDLVSA
jgi:hypothetical protein